MFFASINPGRFCIFEFFFSWSIISLLRPGLTTKKKKVDFGPGTKYENCKQKLDFYGFSHGLVPYYLQFAHLIPLSNFEWILDQGLNVKIVNNIGLNHD